jgi:signal peptide peptidase SppA
VRGIVFDVNSHGGQVYGCFELADYIREKRAEKPSVAVVDAVSCSAAYALSSAAGKMVVSPSGDVGSIGVICVHFDYSEMYKNIGIKVTPVMAGDHKFDGNPYEPLPDEVRKDLQAGVDKTYSQFVTLVSKNRGMEEQAVRSTEARVYDADEALELGLVDEVATAIDAVSAFHTELSGSNNPNRSFIMADNTNAGAAADEIEQASKDATASSKQRIAGILNHENAKGREALAQHLALNTDLDLETAAAALAASPKAEAPKANAAAGFNAAMANGNPNVGAGGEGAEGDGEGANALDTPDKRAAAIVADFQRATGRKPATA